MGHLEAFHYPLPSKEVILSPINPPERPDIPLTSIPLISIRTPWSRDRLLLRQRGESFIKIPTPLKDYADYFPLLSGVLVLAVLRQPECCVAPSFHVCLMSVFRQQQEVAVLSNSCSRPRRFTPQVIFEERDVRKVPFQVRVEKRFSVFQNASAAEAASPCSPPFSLNLEQKSAVP